MDKSSPIIEDKSTRAGNPQPKGRPSLPVDWWDLLPLIQEPQCTPAVHWTPLGIVTAHPSKPIILLYPQPPSTSERKVFPSDRRISESEAFGPARVLSVSESGEHVFAYFPLANGPNSGAWCIWVNMLLRQCLNVEQGEAVVDCWWLGSARQRVIDESGHSIRLPQLGPRIAYHSPAALLLSENFTLHLICEPSMHPPPESPLFVTTANAWRATANASLRQSVALDPYSGFICSRAAMGLSYSDSSILIAMQAILLPSPCLPLSDTQSIGLSVPSTTFLTHAHTDDWENTGSNPTVHLCEVIVTYTGKRGWDMQTNPVSPVPVPSLSHLSHLHFIPKILEGDSAMDIDGAITSSGRYLVVGAVQFGNYSSAPETSIAVHLLQKEIEPSASSRWTTHLKSTRVFGGHAALAMCTARPTYGKQTGLIISFATLSSESDRSVLDKFQVLAIPSLQNDEDYATLNLQNSCAPPTFAVSPSGNRIVSQSLRNHKEFGFHPYPTRKNVTENTKWKEEFMHALLSSREGSSVHRLFSAATRDSKLDLIDSAWAILESESGGGGQARWSMQYFQELLLVEINVSGDAKNQERQTKIRTATLDFLSIPVAKGALVECHGRDLEGPYDADCIWPLAEMCGWIMEFSESVLAASGEYANVVRDESSTGSVSQDIDPRLLILLHPTLLNTWTEALTLVSHFLEHVDGPKGASSDNKALVTRAVEDILNQSPLNLSPLLDALKVLSTRQFPSSVEWRKAYRSCQISGSLAQSMASAVETLVVQDIVSLLPLHVRMAGLNLLPRDGTHQERDIITKKPLIQGEVRRLGYRTQTSCSQCNCKTMVDFRNTMPMTTSRWQRWETSFQRCICGGRWKLST